MEISVFLIKFVGYYYCTSAVITMSKVILLYVKYWLTVKVVKKQLKMATNDKKCQLPEHEECKTADQFL